MPGSPLSTALPERPGLALVGWRSKSHQTTALGTSNTKCLERCPQPITPLWLETVGMRSKSEAAEVAMSGGRLPMRVARRVGR